MTNPVPTHAPKTDTPATQEIRSILVAAIDRDITDESSREVAVIAANAIYWRNRRIRELESTLAAERASLVEMERNRDEVERERDAFFAALQLSEKCFNSERASRLQAERKAWNDAIDAASTACDGQAHLDDVSLTDEEEAWNRACNECGNAVDALSKPSVSPEQEEP